MSIRAEKVGSRGHETKDHAIDVEAVNSQAARALYKKRQAIYPKLAHGVFRNLKWVAMIVLLAIYYLTPWIRWDRGVGRPDQAVLVDFAGRRFYFFPIELWPQEIYYVTGLLIVAALGIFLSSALFGRVWCGYACPQTVWTDLYIHVERLIEGDRNERIRLDKAPMSFSKAMKKVSKHALWILIAALTGGAWVFYFGDAPTLFREIFTGQASATIYLFIGILTFTTYALAGTMREQVCTYLCPWPRIQAAMIDSEALSVTYRPDRGEPRGAHKKGEAWEGRGDCIDCKQCVAVCPQGIDIRDGDQLECINCALCIDACDSVMEKVGRPKGLIAYDSYADIDRRMCGAKPEVRLLRPRTFLYATLMAVVGALMVFGLMHRSTLDLDAIRDRNPPFVRLADGSFRNDFTLKIVNKAPQEREVSVALSGLPEARFHDAVSGDRRSIVVRAAPDAVTSLRVHIFAPSTAIPGLHHFKIVMRDRDNGDEVSTQAAFVVGGTQ